jgi:hypothetical protein
MSESILEQIAVWHAAAIAEITVANGYPQTLSVKREGEYAEDGIPITDLSAICFLGDGQRKEEDATVTDNYVVRDFIVCMYLLGSGTTGLPLGTRQAQLIASVQKRIGLEREAGIAAGGSYCGGLAARVSVGPDTIDTDPERFISRVFVPVVIEYWVNKNDPTIQ